MGSSDFARQLVSRGLVDSYRMMVEPVLLGGGKRIFPEDGRSRPLRLVSASTTSTGVILATYEPADTA